MERETKKRKMECIAEQERQKEEEDEEKMEKFFALLRRNKEMHDHIRRNSNGIFKEREEIKKAEEERVIVRWNPSFQPEDFSEDGKDGSQVAGPSERKHEEKKDKGDQEGTDLDLKLSL